VVIGWPVPLLEKIMTSRDIAEAMAYNRLAPFGEKRADLRAGIIASVIANSNASSKSKTFKPQDFMPDFSGKPKKKKSMKAQILEALNFGNSSKPSN